MNCGKLRSLTIRNVRLSTDHYHQIFFISQFSPLVKRLTFLFNGLWKRFERPVVRGSNPRGGTN